MWHALQDISMLSSLVMGKIGDCRYSRPPVFVTKQRCWERYRYNRQDIGPLYHHHSNDDPHTERLWIYRVFNRRKQLGWSSLVCWFVLSNIFWFQPKNRI